MKQNLLPTNFANKIVCGDSKQVLSNLPDNCVDLIFTSPPYNFDMEYENHNDKSKWDDYFNTLGEIFNQCIRVLKHGGRLILNVQPLFSDYIPTHHMISKQLLDKGLLWKAEILWEKNNRNCAYTAWGSWKSPSSPYFKYTWEFVEVFCKGTLIHKGDKNLIDITGNEFKTWVDAKWSIAPERNMDKWGHPAMFPEELAYRVLKLFSYQNDVILDPFNGAGTTTFVASKTNRIYLGIDKGEKYCKIAENRIQSYEMKDYSSMLDEKLALLGRDKSLKERNELPNKRKTERTVFDQ